MAKSKRHVVQVNVPVPPPDPRPYVPPICLPSAGEMTFLALHNSVMGVPMHWLENQPVPHPKDRQWCAGCKRGQTPRWTGFLGVISVESLNRYILSIPPSAFTHSGAFRERSDAGRLAGTIFTAWRFGASKSKTNPAKIEIKAYPYPIPKMNPFPLNAACARLWRMETLVLVEEIKRPEDAAMQFAREFVSFAQVLKQHEQAKKEHQQ